MKKEIFTEIINNIQEEMKRREEYAIYASKLFPNAFKANLLPDPTFIEQCIANLEKLSGDIDEWISWWIWDTDFGVKNNEVTFKDGKKKKIITVEDLYNLINNHYEEA
jgi:hypothetical protein